MLRLAVLSGLGIGHALSADAAEPSPSADELTFFEKRVRPVLVDRCYSCHSAEAEKIKGGLLLDTREGWRKGGDSGPAIVPGDPTKSLLIDAVRYGNPDLQMPPKGKLPARQITDLEMWVKMGAPDPRVKRVDSAPTASSPAADAANHWAFRPPLEVSLPTVANRSWVRTPVDAFVLATLESKGLSPAPHADKRTLIRRVTFDLVGLPPAPEEVTAFLADHSPDAFTRLVERLLASPHYGERWGRHWLDLARYADSNGQDENRTMGNAFRYRDYVVQAFNDDKPYDQFIREQLAGDLLPAGRTPAETYERWTATGFLVLGPKLLAEQDKPKLVMDIVDEQIDVATKTFLGLTVSCARCHDHKFDPITARDYYALAGIFKSTRTMEHLKFESKWNERKLADTPTIAEVEAHPRKLEAARKELDRAVKRANQAVIAAQRKELPRYLLATAPLLRGKTSVEQIENLEAMAREQQLDAPLLRRWCEFLLARDNQPLTGVWRAYADFPSEGFTTAGPAGARSLTDSSSAIVLSPLLAGRLAEAAPDSLAALADIYHLIIPGPGDRPQNASPYGPGKLGGAMICSGTNFLELAHADELEPEQLTVTAWVRATERPAGEDNRRWLVSKNANEWENGHFGLLLQGDTVGAYLNIGGGREHAYSAWSSPGHVPPGEWFHLAMTYDGTDLKVYRDGKVVANSAIHQPRTRGTGPLNLARRPDGFVTFKGELDEARLYARALDGSEIAALFTRPDEAAKAGLIHEWGFNDLSRTEQIAVIERRLHEQLFATNGLFRLPENARDYYPNELREEIVRLEAAHKTLETNPPPEIPLALAVEDAAVTNLPVLIRGNHLTPAQEVVPRGFIAAIPVSEAPTPSTEQSGRLQLAEWLMHPDHPLTSRVMVNRIWQGHFGEGLVRTPDNFGLRGEPPTHPELLDFLAREFVRERWSIKVMHRLILLSSAYQMSAAHNPQALAVDPDNRWLWRMNPRRLEAEPIRDALLAVSGSLDRTVRGSLLKMKNYDYARTNPKFNEVFHSPRRAIYLPVIRSTIYDVFGIFDYTDAAVSLGKRSSTVVPHQALFFLNSPFVIEQARQFAASLLAATDADDVMRIQQAYERAFGRPAASEEIARAQQYLARVETLVAEQGTKSTKLKLAVWESFCQTLVAANEFIHLN